MGDQLTDAKIQALFYKLLCSNYDDDWITTVLQMLNDWPVWLAILLFGTTLMHRDIYYSLFSLVFFIDWFINWGLREAIGEEGPTKCTSQFQNPAYAGEAVVLIALWLLLTSGPFLRMRLNWIVWFMLSVFVPIAIFARMWLHQNTPQQIMWGALAGLLSAMIWVPVCVYLLASPKFYEFIVWKRFMFMHFADTLVRWCEPIFYLTEPFATINVKQSHESQANTLQQPPTLIAQPILEND